MNFALGELFCGPGGMALGAHMASCGEFSFSHGWAVDYDEKTCSTYARNIAGADGSSVRCMDARRFAAEEASSIDGFAYGFPCNDFSLVGERKGTEGDFGPLYRCGLPVLEHHRPKFFVAENVGGIRSANEGNAFVRILSELSTAGDGYVLSPHLYKFEEYGVPQTRHRVVIVGIRKDMGFSFRPLPRQEESYPSAKRWRIRR